MKIWNEEFCTVIVRDGMHLIQTPKGEILKGIILTRVTDEANEMPYVLVKMNCNIEGDKSLSDSEV